MGTNTNDTPTNVKQCKFEIKPKHDPNRKQKQTEKVHLHILNMSMSIYNHQLRLLPHNLLVHFGPITTKE